MNKASDKQDSRSPEAAGGTEFAALFEYLKTVAISLPAPVTDAADMQAIAPELPVAEIEREILSLPAEQLLYTFRHCRVYCGTQQQMPQTLREITRLREYTFRAFQEGSGLAVDTDAYDSTYTHLFVWDTEARKIVGGYRLGRADLLRKQDGAQGVYLSAMFDFDEAFFTQVPKLEIGRSFVTPEFQRNHYSLHLLWCGIGHYLVKHPQYRQVYGVVSMSRLYDARTSAAIRDALVEPLATVSARAAYELDLGEPWRQFLNDRSTMTLREVSVIVKELEQEERDIPVLIRHYHKLGARFVSAAVDASFNNTPGLLLCLDVPKIPAKYIKQYFGEGGPAYLAYSGD